MTRLILPYPVSANRYWRPVRLKAPKGSEQKERITIVPTSEAKSYKSECAWIARSKGMRAPLIGRVALTILLVPKNGICMDLDNALKVAIDALKGVAYADDSQVFKIAAERTAPNGTGALVVDVMAMDVAQPPLMFADIPADKVPF